MGPDRRSDDELLRAARRDPDAFAAYYRRWERPILAWLMRQTGDPETAADLAAESFATALTAVRRGKATGEAGWIWSIARSRLLDAYRRGKVADRARRQLRMQPITVDDHAAAVVEGLDLARELEAAMQTLDPQQRDAIRSRFIDDESYGQIAKRLQVSEQVVRKRVSRGLSTLRETMGDRS